MKLRVMTVLVAASVLAAIVISGLRDRPPAPTALIPEAHAAEQEPAVAAKGAAPAEAISAIKW